MTNFKEKYLIVLILVCFIAVGFYYSYAIFVTKQLQENVVVIKTFNDDIKLSVNGDGKTYRIKGNVNEDINVSFTNIGSNKYHYLVLVKGIKTGVKVTSTDEIKGIIEDKEEKNILVHINNETSEDIELEFFIEISTNEQIDKLIGYSYINYEENYDHTRANAPEINKLRLIPVSYKKVSEKEGYWYKTDINNQKSVWYDYDNGIWANAVLMNEENYRKYQKMNINSEIMISDIIGFYVWIPRFKYYIINSTSYTNYERINNIVFEEGNNSTGTLSCIDRISEVNNEHIYSEVCNDDVYQHIYDNLSTYTHPSFNNEKGFWVAKFLTSDGGKSLPNMYMLKDNITDANTISKKIGSHILTNMEYGAIVLLSNSSYGKTGNMLYSGSDNTTFYRIYANTYVYNITGCSSEYSIYTKSFLTTKANKCLEYNDLTDLSHYSNGVYYPIGYGGAGASTTGTVYGIYDLANLNGELVSAYVANIDGSVPKLTNYYDVYSHNDYLGKVFSSNNIYNLYRYKYGDAIREHFKSFNENGMWYDGSINQNVNTGILVRGKNSSVYSVSIEDVSFEAFYRLVLKP